MQYPTELTGVEIGGVYIHEPGGMISNIAVCVISFYFYIRLNDAESSFERSWRNFILCIGIGSLGGTFTHGLPTYLGPTLFFWLWWVKNSFVPLANFYAVRDFFSGNKFVRATLIAKILVVIIALFLTESFLPAIIDLALTYILVIVFSLRKKSEFGPYRTIASAFILALLSGTLYLIKYDIDPLWFTHKDMVHVFVIISLMLIYRAVKESKRKAA